MKCLTAKTHRRLNPTSFFVPDLLIMKHLLFLLLTTSVFAEVKTETLTIAMRDGVKLTADLYRDDAVTKAPVILTRTPYDRTKQKGTGEKWAKAGSTRYRAVSRLGSTLNCGSRGGDPQDEPRTKPQDD